MSWENILKASTGAGHLHPSNRPQKDHYSNPRAGTKVAGGEITMQELRTALGELSNNEKPEGDKDPLMLVCIPNEERDGVEIGIFTYGGLQREWGESKAKHLVRVGNSDSFGLFWLDSVMDKLSLRPAIFQIIPELSKKINQGLIGVSIEELTEGRLNNEKV